MNYPTLSLRFNRPPYGPDPEWLEEQLTRIEGEIEVLTELVRRAPDDQRRRIAATVRERKLALREKVKREHMFSTRHQRTIEHEHC